MGKHIFLLLAASALFACGQEQSQGPDTTASTAGAAPPRAQTNTQANTAAGTQTPRASDATPAPQPERMSQEQREALMSDRRFQEGRHYDLLTPQQPTVETDDGRIEVVEVFQYSCPACFNFEPYVEDWDSKKADYINFVRVPAPWNPLSELHARAYYTADALGIVDEIHGPIFREFHTNRNYLDTEAKLADFFADFGVDGDMFESTFNSFSVNVKIQRARDLIERYQVGGTPGIVVAGKYLANGADSYGNWFDIINELAAVEWANAE